MRIAHAVFLAFALFTSPTIVFAHGEAPKPRHGGLVQESQELWLELVIKETDVSVYVLDETQKPVPAADVSGTATVLVSGKSYKVDLAPGSGESVDGKLPLAATGRLVATVALKVGRKSISARFVGP